MNRELEKELCKILEVEVLDPRFVAVDFSDCDFEDVKETDLIKDEAEQFISEVEK